MKQEFIGKPTGSSELEFVMFDPEGNVVPIFCENFIGKWAFNSIRTGHKTWLGNFLFGKLEKLPERFPYGRFKSKRVVGKIKRPLFRNFFKRKYTAEELEKLESTAQKTCKKLITNI